MKDIITLISEELGESKIHVENVVTMLDEGNTIPFIARYRKEMHGSMDDTKLRKLSERLTYLRNLSERKETVKAAIEEQGKLTEELSAAIDAAETLAVLEDLYRPYKQKRATRASKAKEKGLEPLADFLRLQGPEDPKTEAEKYIDPEKGVADVNEALQGAMDIVAEAVSDSPENRDMLRRFYLMNGAITSVAAKEEDSVYGQYYRFAALLSKVQGHQVLAMNRGEKEGFLKVSVEIEEEKAKMLLVNRFGVKMSPSAKYLKTAIEDAFDRLIQPSLEREMRSTLTDKASEGAIHNFALNLEPLLMQPPVKGFITMGLDPGYQHGCKVAVVDGTGKVLDTTVVYPTFNDRKKEECIRILSDLIVKHKVKHLAIGNGTASRETEAMAAEMLGRLRGGQSYAIVNEAGASVYSASELGAKEFPEYDVNLRSAISIARRLQDPLAELVKIDPMSIGVGQYQHDMPEKQLETTLAGVVEDCVNKVGVDLNTASVPLLLRVSGLTKTTAQNIVTYREENGAFKSRKELKKVPKLGAKAFEQCAGFLRVPESKELLDNTSVHPESYEAAEKLLEILGYTKKEAQSGLSEIGTRLKMFGEEKAATACGVGVPTLRDIAEELKKPGRDPREELPPVVLRKDVLSLEDLRPGMKLKGTVRNVIDFGAFVDIGVHHDGLVHISRICDRFIKHPSEVLKVGDIVDVTVLDVDFKKNRISLSMRE